MDEQEVSYLVALGQVNGLHQNLLTLLMDYFGDAERAWREYRRWHKALPLTADKCDDIVGNRKEVEPETFSRYREKLGVKVVTVKDKDFPAGLRTVEDPPYYLFYYGSLPDPDRLAIAVVGSRKCSDYGKAATHKVVTDLVQKAGVAIISGMAEGIDAAAHKAVLQANGYTAAVLGNGIDVIYPSFHGKLYRALKEKGAVISEFPLGCGSYPQNFPQRNRLISGLSSGVFVTEARIKSGAYHTVKHGLEQGKEIYALPHSIFSGGGYLPHYLIETGQAKFAACAEDILEDFIDVGLVERMQREEKQKDSCLAASQGEREALAALEKGGRSFDELLKSAPLTASELSSFLTRLEIEGAVYETPEKKYILKNN
ncbi:MAG TPA: DNA-processing protein DprA [Clostridiales bacterium]|nr:DNA-processing protein DprA [Clostridiales bacterium]